LRTHIVNLVGLLRPKHWVKNTFLFIPAFFAAKIGNLDLFTLLLGGWAAFNLVASGVYILNDYRDIEADRLHPEKSRRPLASGAVDPGLALAIMVLCMGGGLGLGWWLLPKFGFILAIYLAMNVGYSLGLKNISILDTMIVAAGFVLRVKAGGVLAKVYVTEWLTVMVFLLALFMAFAKRRDDLLIKLQTGTDMRKAIKGYSLEFVNLCLPILSSIILVSYLMYALSPAVAGRLGTDRVYYTFLFVLAGVMRYLQLVYIHNDSGSPVKLLYRDRFIQLCIVGWVVGFYVIIYYKNLILF
jgi:decaprenyl-phosphate phosphoribosyltransferase